MNLRGYGDAGSNNSSDDTTYEGSFEDVLERDDLVTLRTSLEEGLSQVEHNGADRETAAQMLDLYADAVREGHVYPPSRRGNWWQDVHEDGDDDE